MEKIFIQDFLKKWDIEIRDICLVDFDAIGEYTAKKNSSRNS